MIQNNRENEIQSWVLCNIVKEPYITKKQQNETTRNMKLMILNRKWTPQVQFFSLIVVALYPYDIIIIIILILMASPLQRPFLRSLFYMFSWCAFLLVVDLAKSSLNPWLQTTEGRREKVGSLRLSKGTEPFPQTANKCQLYFIWVS